MDDTTAVEWLLPMNAAYQLGKAAHAFQTGEALSVCTRMERQRALTADMHTKYPRALIDERKKVCALCRKALGLPTRPSVPWSDAPVARREMVAEFMGGPFDGVRVTLLVEATSVDSLKVVGRRYVVTAAGLLGKDAARYLEPE